MGGMLKIQSCISVKIVDYVVLNISCMQVSLEILRKTYYNGKNILEVPLCRPGAISKP